MARYSIDNREGPVNFALRGEERTVQNCKNLLRTLTGEVPWLRSMGLDGRLLHLPLPRLRELLPQAVESALSWEPGAALISCRAEADREGAVIITCEIEVETDE